MIAIASSVNASENVIDSDPNNFATIDLTAGIGAPIGFAVTDALETYSAGTYVSFDISSNRLVNASVLSGLKIRLIKDGVLLNHTYTPSLLAGVGALAGEQRQRIGIVANEEFDGAQLRIDGLLNIGLLGNLKVYGVSFQKLCSMPLVCNQTIMLSEGNQPVIINDQRTGVSGLANVTVLNNAIEGALLGCISV